MIYTDTLHDGPQVLTLDPLDFLARATSHIPHPRQHQVRHYGAYAPRAHSARRKRLAANSGPSPNQTAVVPQNTPVITPTQQQPRLPPLRYAALRLIASPFH